ncbi:unnamed protein product, partial [Prorocentrum cordatum]
MADMDVIVASAVSVVFDAVEIADALPSPWPMVRHFHLVKESPPAGGDLSLVEHFRPITVFSSWCRECATDRLRSASCAAWCKHWCPQEARVVTKGVAVHDAAERVVAALEAGEFGASWDYSLAFDRVHSTAATTPVEHMGMPSHFAKMLGRQWSNQRRWLRSYGAIAEQPECASTSLPQGDPRSALALTVLTGRLCEVAAQEPWVTPRRAVTARRQLQARGVRADIISQGRLYANEVKRVSKRNDRWNARGCRRSFPDSYRRRWLWGHSSTQDGWSNSTPPRAATDRLQAAVHNAADVPPLSSPCLKCLVVGHRVDARVRAQQATLACRIAHYDAKRPKAVIASTQKHQPTLAVFMGGALSRDAREWPTGERRRKEVDWCLLLRVADARAANVGSQVEAASAALSANMSRDAAHAATGARLDAALAAQRLEEVAEHEAATVDSAAADRARGCQDRLAAAGDAWKAAAAAEAAAERREAAAAGAEEAALAAATKAGALRQDREREAQEVAANASLVAGALRRRLGSAEVADCLGARTPANASARPRTPEDAGASAPCAAGPPPEDGNEFCVSWAAEGQCEANLEYMRDNCAKSCRKGPALPPCPSGAAAEPLLAAGQLASMVAQLRAVTAALPPAADKEFGTSRDAGEGDGGALAAARAGAAGAARALAAAREHEASAQAASARADAAASRAASALSLAEEAKQVAQLAREAAALRASAAERE